MPPGQRSCRGAAPTSTSLPHRFAPLRDTWLLSCAERSISVWSPRSRGDGVPRTVKLSERFYEKFGHDLVDELVNWFNETDTAYRTELRELNDVNFARFDAKLEQRLAEFGAG